MRPRTQAVLGLDLWLAEDRGVPRVIGEGAQQWMLRQTPSPLCPSFQD